MHKYKVYVYVNGNSKSMAWKTDTTKRMKENAA